MAARLNLRMLSTPCLSPASVAYPTMVELSSIRDVDSSIPNQNICNGQYSSQLHINGCCVLLANTFSLRCAMSEAAMFFISASSWDLQFCRRLGCYRIQNHMPAPFVLSSRLQGMNTAAAYNAGFAFVAPLQSGARHAHRPNLLHVQIKLLGLIGHARTTPSDICLGDCCKVQLSR